MAKKHENILSHFSNREMKKNKQTTKRYCNTFPRFTKLKGSNDTKFWWWYGAIWTLTWKQSLWKTVCPSSVTLKMCTLNTPATALPNIRLCWLSSICPPDFTLCPPPCFKFSEASWQRAATAVGFREERRWSCLFIPSYTFLKNHVKLAKSLDERSQLLHMSFSALSPGSDNPFLALTPSS